MIRSTATAILVALGLTACGYPSVYFADGSHDGSLEASTDGHDAIDTLDAPMDVPFDQPDAPDACATMCAGRCADLATDPHHCGRCETDCTLLAGVDAANVRCVAGACDLTHGCSMGRAHCTGPESSGCETDVTSASHCGDCTTSCSGSMPVCNLGTGGYACSSACSGGRALCGTSCVDTQTDPAHCGSCTGVCDAPMHASATCTAAACGFHCDTGFHACGSTCVPDDSASACGPMCTPCPAVANGNALCAGGVCGFVCNPGFHTCGAACDSNADVASCGSACTPCPHPAHATATCDGTACGFHCDAGWADCNGTASDGCEADLSAPTSCGSCGTTCSGAMPLCRLVGASYTCAASCTAPTPMLCGSSCVDPTSDVNHCGSCTSSCPTVANGSARCSAGSCSLACNTGYHLCSGACVSNASTASCGASCTPCSPPANATATCDGTTCGFTCNAGFHLCGGACVSNGSVSTCGASCSACPTPANASATCDGASCGFTCNTGFHACGGICVSNTDVATCGSLCSPCASPPHATATCASGTCGFACAAGWADCDHDPSNGCEADLSSATSCGACGTVCSGGTPVCQASGGTYSCASGCTGSQVRCGMSCIDTSSDPNNCGSCMHTCSAPANAIGTCSGGVCGFNCNASFHNCSGACVSNSSTGGCGTSCTPCSPPMFSNPTCDGTSCGFSCLTGYHACGAACAVNTSPNSCGTSCAPCVPPANATSTCDGTACGFTCNTGFHNCGGVCVSNGNVNSCGVSSCSPCVPPANATSTCDGTACGFTCNTGFHNCGGTCVTDTSINTCGTSCTPCVPPSNATASCDGTMCGFQCNAGLAPSGGACVPIPAPRPIAPLSMTFVTSNQPLFRWANGSPGDGARVQICRDHACATMVSQFDVSGTSGSPPSALSAGSYFVRLAGRAAGNVGTAWSTVWEFAVTTQSSSTVHTFDRAFDDTNADGFADAVIAADGSNAVYGFAGVSPASGSASSAWRLTPTAMPNEGLGTAAIAAGDVNGDGFGDLLVTTPNAMGSDPVVSVFFGAAGGFSSTPSQVLSVPTGAVSFGTGVAAAGDVNGDGYGDVIIGSGQYLGVGSSSAYVYTGSSSGLASTPITIHGGSVSFGAFVGAGDTNGDGFGDVFVADSASHVVYLYRGSASGPSATADSTLNDALFTLRTGSTFLALDAGGDIDGDGYADLLIGASDLHQVHVYRCTPTGIAASAYASVAPAAGGAPARFVGDINGDGRGDFAVGDATGAGNAVYVYEGSATGAMLATTTTAASLGVGTTAYFGATLSGGADFDRDGIADFAIGAYNGGSAFLYRGSTLSPSVPLTFTRPATLATSYGNSLDL